MATLEIKIKGETRDDINRLLFKVEKEIVTANFTDYIKQVEGEMVGNWVHVNSDGYYRWRIKNE